MFKDILLPLPSYPRPIARAALRRALEVPRLLEAHVTCLVGEPDVPVPVIYHPFSKELEHQLSARQEEVHEAAVAQLAAFEEEARRAGLSRDGRIVVAPNGSGADPVVEFARLRDLSVVPFVENDEACADLVVALAFESGRPVLVLPEKGGPDFSLDRVVVAWDFGRAATRAVGDALPLLKRAGEVRIVTVNRDKQPPENASGAELAAHLARNGVKVELREVERGNRGVGAALDAAASDADLLVMGAFGHSRLRDFFLGGATDHVLKAPRLPTFLSH